VVPPELARAMEDILNRKPGVKRKETMLEVVVQWVKQGIELVSKLPEGLALLTPEPVLVRGGKSKAPAKTHMLQFVITTNKTRVKIRLFKDMVYSQFHIAAVRIDKGKTKMGVAMPIDNTGVKKLGTASETLFKTNRTGKQKIVLYADGKPVRTLVIDIRE
jgi:hypothetical protein